MLSLRTKRGQGLPLNTVIIAILVVLVLVVIVAFFLGGTTGLTNTVKKVFFGTTVGTDITLAVENCKQYCRQVENWPRGTRGQSPYCQVYVELDLDNDGEADLCSEREDRYIRHYCWGQQLNVPCTITEAGLAVEICDNSYDTFDGEGSSGWCSEAA